MLSYGRKFMGNRCGDVVVRVLDTYEWGKCCKPTYDRFSKRSIFQRSQSEIADFDSPRGASNENIVALEISMDDGRRPRVEEHQTFQNLPTPRLENLRIYLFESLQIPKTGTQQFKIIEHARLALFHSGYENDEPERKSDDIARKMVSIFPQPLLNN